MKLSAVPRRGGGLHLFRAFSPSRTGRRCGRAPSGGLRRGARWPAMAATRSGGSGDPNRPARGLGAPRPAGATAREAPRKLCGGSATAIAGSPTPRHATPRHATPRHATPRHLGFLGFPGILPGMPTTAAKQTTAEQILGQTLGQILGRAKPWTNPWTNSWTRETLDVGLPRLGPNFGPKTRARGGEG